MGFINGGHDHDRRGHDHRDPSRAARAIDARVHPTIRDSRSNSDPSRRSGRAGARWPPRYAVRVCGSPGRASIPLSQSDVRTSCDRPGPRGRGAR